MRPISRLYPIKTSPYLMDEDVLPKLKFINEKNIKPLKENWCIDFIFLGEDFVVHSLVDVGGNLGASLVLILSYVSDRRELSLSKHKLENMFFFTCLTSTGK